MIRVLMLCEGTYPYFRGGVSTWTHNIISSLDEFRFTILCVTPNPYVRERYKLPGNVGKVLNIPLWGTEVVGEHEEDFSLTRFLKASRATDVSSITSDFVPHLEEFLDEVKYGCKNPDRLRDSIVAMHDYLSKHELKKVFRSRPVWRTFRDTFVADDLYGDVRIGFLIDFARVMGHMMRILSYEYPEADVCHSSAASLCGLPAIVHKEERDTPFLLTEHGVYLRERILDLPSDTSMIERILLVNFYRAITLLNYHCADKILPVCKFNVNWELELRVPEEKVEVIYNGVDVDRFRPMDVDVDRSRKRVVVMARIEKLKDILNVVEAMDHVRERVPEALCEIYGPISDESYYRVCRDRVTDLNLEDHVKFMGPTDKPEVAYNRADVVAQPSLSEGFPFTVVEAMACGKPVVATDVGGVREAIGGCGIVVPARSPRKLAEGIVKVLRDETLARRLGEAARRRVLSMFTYGRFVEDYRRVYVEALSEKVLREVTRWLKS